MAVDLSALGDLGPVKTDPSDFVLDDSAQQAAPIPPPPDVARYIPTSTVEQAQRQQQADEWDQQARQKIADMWEQQTQATQDQAVQRWLTPPQYGPPTPTTYQPVQTQTDQGPQPDVNPVTAEPTQNPVVQQFLNGLGGLVDKMKPNPQDAAQAGDTTKVLPTLESVLAPAGETLNRLTGGASGELAGKLGNVTLGDLAGKAQQLGIAGDVTPQDIQQMPGKDLTVGDVASGAASLVQPTPAGPVPGAALTPAGRAAGVANVLEGASPAADIAGAGSDTFDMSHPLVQYIAKNLGDDLAQKAVVTLNNPSRMQRILKAPGRITTEADQAAYEIYRGSKDAGIMAAVQDGGDAGQAAVEAAPAHQPDADLAQQLQQSVENAQANPAGAGRVGAETSPVPEPAPPTAAPPAAASGETAGPPAELAAAPTPSTPEPPPTSGPTPAAPSAQGTPRVPVWQQGLALVGHTDPVVEDAVVRNAAREELAAGSTGLPSGRLPGGIEAQGIAEQAAANQQAVHDAARAVNQATLRQGAEEAARMAPPAPESPFGPSGAGAPPEVPPTAPSGRAPGNPPPAGPAVPPMTALRLGSQTVGAAAGGAYEWQQSDKDMSLATIARVAAGMAGGAAAGYIGFGGAPTARMIGARALDTYIGGLVSLRTMALKGAQDGADILVGGPAIKFAQAALTGHPVTGAQQAVAMYHALADGVGVVAGLRAAVRELEPGTLRTAERFGQDATDALTVATKTAEHSTASPGQYAATASLRGISALTEFARQLMMAQEMAADRVAMSHGLQAFGSTEDQAARVQKIVNDRLLMGDPNGGLGKVALAIGQTAQKFLGGRVGTPFVRIPSNFLDKAFSSIPVVGLLNMAGADSKTTVLAQQALGNVALLGLKAALGDNVTGAGPSDPAMAQMWRDNGYQAYSVKLPGSNQWTAVKNLPFWLKGPALFLGLAGDVQNGWNDPGKLGAAAVGFGKAVGSQEFMPELLKLIENGLTPSQIGGETTGAVPWYLRQTNAALRGYVADSKGTAQLPPAAGMTDKIGADVNASLTAGVNANVPPRLDVTGQPVPNSNAGMGVFSPFQSTTEQHNPVIDAFGNVGVSLPKAPTDIAASGTSAKRVALSGAQQQAWLQAHGDYLRQQLPAAGLKDDVQAKALLAKAKTAADSAVRADPSFDRSAAVSSKQQRSQQANVKGDIWRQAAAGGASVAPAAATTPRQGGSVWDKARAA